MPGLPLRARLDRRRPRVGPMCRAMAAIMADGDGSVARDGKGRVGCAKRMEAEERKRSAELAKYRRRMKGDWT